MREKTFKNSDLGLSHRQRRHPLSQLRTGVLKRPAFACDFRVKVHEIIEMRNSENKTRHTPCNKTKSWKVHVDVFLTK